MKNVRNLALTCLIIMFTALCLVLVACDDDPPTHKHTLVRTASTPAQCTQAGNIAYFKCSECGEMFSDMDGQNQISESDVIIAATGHSFDEAWTRDTDYHWHVATCEHSDEISDKAEHTYGDDNKCIECEFAIINATIEFKDGKAIRLVLYPDIAPITVENFVTLAEQGFYDGLAFHKVRPDWVIQGGAYSVLGNGFRPKTAERIKGEFSANGVKNDIHHVPGVLSMNRQSDDYDSASSEFFICVADCQTLDGYYAAFGKTRDQESLDTAIEISNVATTTKGNYENAPVNSIVIQTVTIEKTVTIDE